MLNKVKMSTESQQSHNIFTSDHHLYITEVNMKYEYYSKTGYSYILGLGIEYKISNNFSITFSTNYLRSYTEPKDKSQVVYSKYDYKDITTGDIIASDINKEKFEVEKDWSPFLSFNFRPQIGIRYSFNNFGKGGD